MDGMSSRVLRTLANLYGDGITNFIDNIYFFTVLLIGMCDLWVLFQERMLKLDHCRMEFISSVLVTEQLQNEYYGENSIN